MTRGYKTHVHCGKCVKWWKIGDIQKYDLQTHRCKQCNQIVRTTTRWLPDREVKRY